MAMSTKELGNYGENLAIKILDQKNIKVIFKNWMCFAGEFDLICREKDQIVFVEVKTRFDSPFSRKLLSDSLSNKKKKKLKTLSQIFMKNYYHDKGVKLPKYRIDFVGILISKTNMEITLTKHIKAAIADT